MFNRTERGVLYKVTNVTILYMYIINADSVEMYLKDMEVLFDFRHSQCYVCCSVWFTSQGIIAKSLLSNKPLLFRGPGVLGEVTK